MRHQPPLGLGRKHQEAVDVLRHALVARPVERSLVRVTQPGRPRHRREAAARDLAPCLADRRPRRAAREALPLRAARLDPTLAVKEAPPCRAARPLATRRRARLQTPLPRGQQPAPRQRATHPVARASVDGPPIADGSRTANGRRAVRTRVAAPRAAVDRAHVTEQDQLARLGNEHVDSELRAHRARQHLTPPARVRRRATAIDHPQHARGRGASSQQLPERLEHPRRRQAPRADPRPRDAGRCRSSSRPSCA